MRIVMRIVNEKETTRIQSYIRSTRTNVPFNNGTVAMKIKN